MPSDVTALFIEHRRSLIDYAAGIMGSRTQAEDIVQEAYIRFSIASGTVGSTRGEPILQPLAYLYAIVRNLSMDWARRSAVSPTVPPTSEQIVSVASDAPSAETVLLHRDELKVLAAALVELPERTRLAFNMSRLEGRPLRDIADRLGVSISRAQQPVRTAMIHAAKRLRDREP